MATTQTAVRGARPTTSRGPLRLVSAVSVITLGAWCWFAVRISSPTDAFCPAVYPTPAGCDPARPTTALLGSVVLLLAAVSLVLLVRWRARHLTDPLVLGGSAVLVVLTLVLAWVLRGLPWR